MTTLVTAPATARGLFRRGGSKHPARRHRLIRAQHRRVSLDANNDVLVVRHLRGSRTAHRTPPPISNNTIGGTSANPRLSVRSLRTIAPMRRPSGLL